MKLKFKEKEIGFTKHAITRMIERNITKNEVLECYKYGRLSFSPTTGHYLYSDNKISVIADFNLSNNLILDVITVFRWDEL